MTANLIPFAVIAASIGIPSFGAWVLGYFVWPPHDCEE